MSGAAVMGTGIVSVALWLDGARVPARVLLVVAGGLWLVLAWLLARRARHDREGLRRAAAAPAALTAVAGTAVVGSGLALEGREWAAAAMLALAATLWLALLGPALRHRQAPAPGSAFLLTVATQALAALAVSLAVRLDAAWLLAPAALWFAAGLAAYATVLARFDARQLATASGDHWIAGGALAISAVVAGQLTDAAGRLGVVSGTGALEVVSLAVWAATMAWLPVLLAAEARHPRLSYDLARWSTVFPVGMYAACSFVVGRADHAAVITDFAHLWVWVALALWAAVAAAALAARRSDARDAAAHRAGRA